MIVTIKGNRERTHKSLHREFHMSVVMVEV
jgi:hypothetical protein